MKTITATDPRIGQFWINAHQYFFDHIQKIEQLRMGLYRVHAGARGIFLIEGGRHAGGGPREWYLEQDPSDTEHTSFTKAIKITGLVDGLRLIDTM